MTMRLEKAGPFPVSVIVEVLTVSPSLYELIVMVPDGEVVSDPPPTVIVTVPKIRLSF